MGYDVFISYSSEDRETAQRIRESLESRGIRCWIDRKDLRFTRQYDREIDQAIRRSRVILWLASPRSIKSDYVKFEISSALNHGKPVGPVYLEPMEPSNLPSPFNLKLAAVQGIEFYAGPAEAMTEKLVQELLVLVRTSRDRRLGVSVAILAILAAVAFGLWSILPDPKAEQDMAASGSAVDVPPPLDPKANQAPKPSQPQAPKPSQPQTARLRSANMLSGPQTAQDVFAIDGPITSPSSGREVGPAVKPLPSHVARLPAADVLKIAYTGSPPASVSQAERPGIQMEILASRSGESTFSPLKDGDTLYSETDDYFFAFRPLSRGYLYVFQVDTVGKKTWLFPDNETTEFSSGINPLEPKVVVQVPSAEQQRVLFLDRTVGVEHVYAVFSSVRWPALEQALMRADQPPSVRQAPGEHPALLAVSVRSPNGLLGRGVGGTRPETSPSDVAASFLVERSDRNNTFRLPLSPSPVQASGSFLVIERWFRHEEPQ